MGRKRTFGWQVKPAGDKGVGAWMGKSKQDRADQRERHAREVEASQDALRASISETQRLVGESDKMLRRHRGEREAEE